MGLVSQVKDEGWWLVVGNPKTREVYALKRVTFLEHLNSNLVLPKNLMPDSQVCHYIGIQTFLSFE